MKALLLKGIFLLAYPICVLAGGGGRAEDRREGVFEDTTVKSTSSIYLTDRITTNDDKNIKARAQTVVIRFMNLLNTIATGLDLEVPETEGIIRKSYLPIESKIFYDSAVVVVDDLRKVESLSQAKEKTAYSYLKDFEIFYKKSEKASVSFSNFQVSNIKKGKYLYIKVTYDCLFANKSKISDEPFGVQKRVAELRVERHNNKWKAWIIDVHFLDSTDLVETNKNDVQVVAGHGDKSDSAVADKDQDNFIIATNKAFTTPGEREAARRKNDSIRTNIAFRNLLDSGKQSLNKGQYIVAYQFFNEAETVINGSGGTIRQGDLDFLQTMIRETRKHIADSHRTPEELYKAHMQEALVFKNQRSYDKALEAYNKAISVRPGDEQATQKKRILATVINNLATLEAKYIAGRYKDAIAEYDKAIKSDPQNSDYYVGRGRCFEKVRDLRKAMNDYKKAIELDENNLHAYKEKGNLHERQGDYANALACYAICAAIDKHDISTCLKIADLNMLIGNSKAALTALEKGISENGKSSMLYFRKAEVLSSLKQPKPAVENFSTSIMLDSSDAHTYYKRGLCYIDLKQIIPAAHDFEKARKLGLDDNSNNTTRQIAADFYNRALKLFTSKYYDSSISLINWAVLIDPANVDYRFQLGQHHLAIHNTDQAIKNFSDVISSNPLHVHAFQLRGLAKYQKRLYREAVLDFQAAVAINPKLPETHKFQGDALLKAGDFLNAIVSYDAAVSVDKSSRNSLKDSTRAALFNGRGEANFHLGKYATALQDFNRSIKIDKSVPELYYQRAKTYLRKNELKEAEEDIRKALAYNPANSQWIAKLGEIYYHQGKYDKAMTQFSRAIPNAFKMPILSEAVYLRAQCYVKLDNYAEAYKDFLVVQSAGMQKAFPDFNTDMGHVFVAFNRPDSALQYFEKENRNASDPMAMYGTSIAHVQKNQLDQSFQWLEKSMATRKIPWATISKDKRIEPLRGDKRYKKLMKKYY
jgi:tetratricopeptide (TPR) repeat protein